MIKNIQAVVKEGLCLGCGACAAICPQRSIKIEQDPKIGNYPKVLTKKCSECGDCLKVCPGIQCPERMEDKFDAFFGAFQSINIAHASEKNIRFNGASGGIVSALAIYLLKSQYVNGIVTVRMHPRNPTKNEVFIAHSRDDVLSAQGSRYSPVSVCELIGEIIGSKGKYAIIGKPCDIQGVRKIVDVKKSLKSKIKLCIGIFCAQTPIRQATLDFLSYQGISSAEVVSLRYRGDGWPGAMVILLRDGKTIKIPYAQMWGDFIGKKQYCLNRCFLCPDGTAEWADISIGDPWHLASMGESNGNSLIIVRTDLGRKIFDKAVHNRYIVTHEVSPKALYQAQPSLIAKRKSIWPRLFVWKLFRKKIPDLKQFPLYSIWKNQPFVKKIRSILAAFYLIITTNSRVHKIELILRNFLKS